MYAGARISRGVIQEICTKLAGCKCVQNLAINLYQKKVIGDLDFHQLQLPTGTGSNLSAALVRASQEREGRGPRLIRDLYLALLDMFAEKCDQWCHRIALYTLRPSGTNARSGYTYACYSLLTSTVIKHLRPLVQVPSDQIGTFSCECVDTHCSQNFWKTPCFLLLS